MSILKLGSICSTAFMLIVFQVLAIAQQGKTSETSDHKQHSETMRECARACSDCQRACDYCATHCGRLASEGEKDHLTTLMTCQDCASVCTAAAQIVARGGPFSALICQSCIDACGSMWKRMREVRWGSTHEHVRQRMSQVRESLSRNGNRDGAQVALLVVLIVIPASKETNRGRSLFGFGASCAKLSRGLTGLRFIWALTD